MLGAAAETAAQLLEAARQKLLAARQERPAPAVDVTRYTSWNAMLASAMLLAGIALDHPEPRDHALATLERIRREALAPDKVGHGAGQRMGWLEDAVQTADAALTAFEFTGVRSWLEWAEALAERAWQDFEDPADGALFDVPADPGGAGLLRARGKPAQDAPTPSANGVAGILAARLAHLTGRERWHARAMRLVGAFGAGLAEAGVHAATMLLAADWLLSPVTRLVVVGPEDDELAKAMRATAWRSWRPRRVIRPAGSAEAAGQVPAELAAMLANASDHVAGYLCAGTSCQPPARSLVEWQASLAHSLAQGHRSRS